MVFKNKSFNKFWRFSCSFQLGIPILVVITVLIAWGTIVESRYDAYAAKKIVYDSWMMWTALSLLVYNLTVVVADRWPWKMRHYPFITVHAGLIVLVLGGYITYKYGVDGQVVVNINGKNNLLLVPQTDVVVYATYDGDRFTKLVDREVDFFDHRPSSQNPLALDLGADRIEITEYVPYARLQNKVAVSPEAKAGASIRFQLMNANVKQVQQITQPKAGKTVTYNLGPAQVNLGDAPSPGLNKNEIYVTPVSDTEVKYTVFHKDSVRPFKSGKMAIGQVVDTGWMGLEFRLLDYLPRASEEIEVTPAPAPTPLTSAAVKIRHRGVEKWLALNDIVKLFGDNVAYLLSYQNRRLDLGFEIRLKDFEVQHYKGTMKAMEYASQVEAVSSSLQVESKISMNEPLKFLGYTIYQASFQEDENTGQPVASVFSVNKDPGRPVKYTGALIFVIGIVWIFYQRRKKATSV